MGCHGCELWPSSNVVISRLIDCAVRHGHELPAAKQVIQSLLAGQQLSAMIAAHKTIAGNLSARLNGGTVLAEQLSEIIEQASACYAGQIHRAKAGRPGFADQFERPKLFPRRMETAANWTPPSPAERIDKPWLTGAPRLIFISDMGDALSANISFDFLRSEIITNVCSIKGSRHLWLWLTKRPGRMAEFGRWLTEREIPWPDNLVAMTTITTQSTSLRVDELRKVPAKFRGLSIEPLKELVKLDLQGIDWVITGGGSDKYASPFDVAWALQLQADCQADGAAFFLKQLGRNPVYNGTPLHLKDGHGGDWSEWPVADWRIREIPAAFRTTQLLANYSFPADHAPRSVNRSVAEPASK
jgi:protein gp37